MSVWPVYLGKCITFTASFLTPANKEIITEVMSVPKEKLKDAKLSRDIMPIR